MRGLTFNAKRRVITPLPYPGPSSPPYKARQESRAGGLGPVAHRNSYKARGVLPLVFCGPTPVGSTPLMLAVTVTPVVGTMDHCVRILLSHGARLDLRRNGEDLESIARRAHDDRVSQMASTSQGHENWDLWLRNKRLRFATSMALLADVRAAGGTWAGYRHAPRLQLDVLRELCARDRAVPPSTLARTRRRRPGQLLARLFGDLPTDVFRHVLRFWRSGREEGISWK